MQGVVLCLTSPSRRGAPKGAEQGAERAREDPLGRRARPQAQGTEPGTFDE